MLKHLILIISILLIGSYPILGKDAAMNDFYIKSNQINTTGIYILGGWAVSNIASGAFGWANSTGSAKYFHQMNVF